MPDYDNNTPVLDHTVINQLRNIDPDGKRNLLRRLVEMYLESAPLVIQEIQQDLAKSDTEHLMLLVHRFKTTNANLGLKRMLTILKQLEAENLSTMDYSHLINLLDSELKSALAALRTLESS